MNRIILAMLLAAFFALSTGISIASDEDPCTLEPGEGREVHQLPSGVTAEMKWSACHTLVKEIEFEWQAEEGFSAAPKHALSKAAKLVTQWEEISKEKICPFVGDVPVALKQRADDEAPYEFGEDIPVSDYGFPGWDGVWIKLEPTRQEMQLTVHYWANP